jgi:hypothetical protein
MLEILQFEFGVCPQIPLICGEGNGGGYRAAY